MAHLIERIAARDPGHSIVTAYQGLGHTSQGSPPTPAITLWLLIQGDSQNLFQAQPHSQAGRGSFRVSKDFGDKGVRKPSLL